MKYKVGSFLYSKTNTLMCDIDSVWHNIQQYDKWKIKKLFKIRYADKVEILNIKNNYIIITALTYVSDNFYTEKEMRKVKLKEINDV